MLYKRNCEIKPGMQVPENVQRIALGIEYNGANLKGFQKQQSAENTVQAALEKALSFVANEEITLVCAGRTDAGVHATGQVIHFDTLAERPAKAWIHGVNSRLPDEVRVHWCHPVDMSFHARFSALSRTYRYVFYSSAVRPATLDRLVTWTSYSLNSDAMQEAGNYLIGEHDFTSFRAAMCQANNPCRHISSIEFTEIGQLLVMEIKANAFLYHMVRNIAGTMLDIGRGAKPIDWMQELLEAQDRSLASPTAAPFGLYFVDVEYPDHFQLPESHPGPYFVQK